MAINSFNVERMRQQWIEKNFISFEDFLVDADAEQIQQYYFNKPADYWDLAIYPDQNNLSAAYPIYRCKPGDPSIPERLKYIRELNDQNQFSYTYRRTEDHHYNLEVFKSAEFIKALEYITGYSGITLDPNYTFMNCYEEGHYNGLHTDGVNGRIAFVYHLSKNWKPWNGGLFVRMDWDWKNADAIVVPKFNNLVMFNVFGNAASGAPHFVTEIAQGCKNKRISFTGWYK